MNSYGGGLRRLTRNPVPTSLRLVAGRTEDRLRGLPWNPCHERRRERAAEPDAQTDARLHSGLVAGRSEIAFRSLRDGNAEIYVMNADSSGQRNLTRSPWNEGSAPGRPCGRSEAPEDRKLLRACRLPLKKCPVRNV